MSAIPTKAIAFTAYNRVGYLARVLESWSNVRGMEDWFFYFSIDPSNKSDIIANMFSQFIVDHKLPYAQVVVNPHKYGVLHHPWVAFENLFSSGSEFVMRVEDDLLVSDDFLEYTDWARHTFQLHDEVAAVVGYVDDYYGSESDVFVQPKFSPWNWGTWKDRWDFIIRDTWDHDYSTYNGRPGFQAGWDWNLDTRVFPARGKSCVYPAQSRVQNIGQTGTHAMPSDFPQSRSYKPAFGEVDYTLVR